MRRKTVICKACGRKMRRVRGTKNQYYCVLWKDKFHQLFQEEYNNRTLKGN